ncbi:proteosome subunit, putative [Theileria equi strain WA]|uniref:Proteosome subunit, putative n=1 Tax=Theileria equi strain WA TaxID=1537102 RepID=L0B199_THEEQ|nr:proteosome subunit, putative [Theileria equi strain WA]AFZ81605.1 proteosome subunit, putative [Theileria equi strain WA]|eukprot:XP_004831271.1 proteosome subunit, putative [Theileria equi strain WA]
MADVDEIVSKFNALSTRKDTIDKSNSAKCFPGAKVGCCTYPDDLIMEYVLLNEDILGTKDTQDASSGNKAGSNHRINVLSDERILYICENVICVICHHLIETGQTNALLGVLVRNEDFFSILPQAKTAKMIRSILERLSQEVKDLNVLYKIFSIYRTWCDSKKRKFLGLRLELKIIIILILMRKFNAASNRLNLLQQEVKAIEDKPLLLDIYLVQAKFHLLLRNFIKMKVAISNAKNIATNINTPVYVTAEIDLLSGILYICEKDYKTAYSYLYESFEAFNMSLCNTYSYLYPDLNKVKQKKLVFDTISTYQPMHDDESEISPLTDKPRYSCHPTTSDISAVFFTFYNLHDYNFGVDTELQQYVDSCGSFYLKHNTISHDMDNIDDESYSLTFESGTNNVDIITLVRADERKLVQSLKYLMLSTVLNDQANEVNTILGAKNKLKYSNHIEIVMIQKISKCYRESSLVDFEGLLVDYKSVILLDPVLQHEIEGLYETLLEKNIIRLLKPYSVVECEFISRKLQLPQDKIEKKLAEMILDNKLKGTIDQGSSTLEVYEDFTIQPIYEDVNKSIGHMTEVIETLYEKAQCAI